MISTGFLCSSFSSGQAPSRAESKGRKVVVNSGQPAAPVQADHSIVADTISLVLGPQFSSEVKKVYCYKPSCTAFLVFFIHEYLFVNHFSFSFYQGTVCVPLHIT